MQNPTRLLLGEQFVGLFSNHLASEAVEGGRNGHRILRGCLSVLSG